MTPVEERIGRLAAFVVRELPDVGVIGLGSGSTAEAVVRELGKRIADHSDSNAIYVATSKNTARLAESVGIPLRDLSDIDSIDIGFDGADEIDPQLNLVKGRGGALLYEKLVAEICRDYMVVSSDEKLVGRLGSRLPLPVEVIPYGWIHTRRRLTQLGLTPELRGGRQDPFLTDAGNVILDCAPDPSLDLLTIAPQIKAITGVVEHGVFPGIAHRAIVVDAEGEVRVLHPS